MTTDFDEIFGKRPVPRQSFTERVTQNQQRPRPVITDDGVEVGGYKPYGYMPTNSAGETCEVLSWVDGTDVPQGIVFQYRFLMQVAFVGDETLRLMLPDSIVVIEGKHLADLRKKLSRRIVTTIQQFHPKLWPAPAPDEPIIQRIEVVRPEKSK